MSKDYSRIALYMKALSDENRAKIFSMISDEELCACKILEELNITQPTLSHHMKTLCESGLVNSRKDGIWTKYTINKENYKYIRQYINDISKNMK